jgi:predicted alpha/beta hydrolase
MKTFELETPNQSKIVATEFQPQNPNGKVLLINSALGMKQKFYQDFAEFFCQAGYFVYTYDYEGIGASKQGSLKHTKIKLRDWAKIDFKTITDFLKIEHPDKKLLLIGHSYGGNSLGLTSASLEYSIFVTVAAQHGYYRLFWKKSQNQLFTLWYILIPILSRIYGYFPSRKIGMGEDLPKNVALEWAKICRNKNWIYDFLTPEENYYGQLTQDILSISIDDDSYAPKAVVDKLHEEGFTNAKIKRVHIFPKEAGVEKIGHFDFFKKKFENTLWRHPLEWFEKV